MFLKAALLILFSLILDCTGVFANDTTAELATGGLVFTKSEHIEMQSEDLFISTKEIKVRYNFINSSDDDIVTQVAFPIPDIPYGVDDFNFAIPTTDPQNILAFKTTANGRPVDVRVEQKALIGGTDRTEIASAPRYSDCPTAGSETRFCLAKQVE